MSETGSSPRLYSEPGSWSVLLMMSCDASRGIRRSDGRIQGIVREVPILEAPGRTAIGRFGWAAQHASLLSFSADAYRNEMGVTSPLQPNDNTLLGDPVDDGVPDPEDTGGPTRLLPP